MAATPSAPAASATARAWLPPLTAATPAARCSGVIVSSLWNAPRTLNEPVRCNSSSFTVTGAPSSADSPGLRHRRGTQHVVGDPLAGDGDLLEAQ